MGNSAEEDMGLSWNSIAGRSGVSLLATPGKDGSCIDRLAVI